MPITLDKRLAAIDVLRQENIFVMDSQRARTQNIRPLKILVVNLMPKKANSQHGRAIAPPHGQHALVAGSGFLYMASHKSKNTSNEYLENYYRTFADIMSTPASTFAGERKPGFTITLGSTSSLWKRSCPAFMSRK